MYRIVRTKKEIDDLWNKASEGINFGTKFRGMSYEDGIDAAIRWLTERDADNPLEDE